MSLAAAVTLLIVGLTLAGVLARPFGLREGSTASLGAALLVALRLVSVHGALATIADHAGVLLFFVALLLLAWTVEASGLFEWAALTAARSAGGRGDRLLLNVFLTGVAITALLSNDATALLLTPTVYIIVNRLKLPALPFVLACTFIADTASTLLPFSNPLNLIVLAAFPTPLHEFLARLLLPSLAAIAINVLFFLVLYRRMTRCRFDAATLPPPASAIRDRRYFQATVAALAALAAGYLAATATGRPVAVPGIVVAVGLLLVALRRGRVRLAQLRGISWTIVPFVAAMFVLVQALSQQGITETVGAHLIAAGGGHTLRTSLLLTFGSAAGANAVNNLPMTTFMVRAIAEAPVLAGHARQAAIWGALVGDAIGPNLTLLGSLATMLWLVLLRDRGLDVRAWDYIRVGLIVTPVMLLTAALLLTVTVSWR